MSTIPNGLTVFRICLIPFFVVMFYLPWEWASISALTLFCLASLTDWLDGFLARYLKQTSSFGAFLDPVADKMIVCVALILLTARHPHAYMAIAAIVVICREIAVSALREWMSEVGKRHVVSVSWVGKVKTTTQMIAIIALLSEPIDARGWALGIFLLYIAVSLTVVTLIQYARIAVRELKQL